MLLRLRIWEPDCSGLVAQDEEKGFGCLRILSSAKIQKFTNTQIGNLTDSPPQLEIVFEMYIPTPADPE